MANTLKDGEIAYIQGSGKKPYELKNTGGVYSCSCPAWKNQGVAIDQRTCKHLRVHLGSAHEDARLDKLNRAEVLAWADAGGGIPEDGILAAAPIDSNVEIRKIVKGQTIAEAKGIDQNIILNRAKEQGRKLRPDEKAQLNGPPVLLAHKYEGDVNPVGWWFSEKMDGVRCYFDGENLISRQGNIYHAPAWFKALLPRGVVLDGELWMGRGKFQQTISVVKRLEADDRWHDVRYMIYDAPHPTLVFEQRMQWLKDNVTENDNIHVVDQRQILTIEHLKANLRAVLEQKGEGLMLRQSGSLYEAGRSYTLLKVKQFHDDEAVVIGYSPGKGRHKGVVGALEVRLKNGKEFKLGTGLNDADRRDPPPIGSTVTFSFQELSDDGVPKFAAFLRVRSCE